MVVTMWENNSRDALYCKINLIEKKKCFFLNSTYFLDTPSIMAAKVSSKLN